ncbi:hypothetical protein NPIL_52061 [Nephila pilipes]|uniref:Uncharacterized protein n=1 Tax=Nephila pilipes TaxID=299642 RepID=A0A8X6NV25_NEPPI|nr:hypothetical protein NPIL_52061 [Nephila pilipes]
MHHAGDSIYRRDDEELTNLFFENNFFTTWDPDPTIEYTFKLHRKEMSSSDEEIPNCERPSAEYEPHPCEPIYLSIRATREASSHSKGSSISSLPVSEGSPSDRQSVGPSALPGPNPPSPYAPDQHFSPSERGRLNPSTSQAQEVQFKSYPMKDDLNPSAKNSQWLIFARN